MQRCPYIHEMKERLLGEQVSSMEPQSKKIPTPPPFIMEQQLHQQPVSTIVRLNADGYGSHTSPTHHRADRTPLMPKEHSEDFRYSDPHRYPKNAKTSLFIIMSFVYAKLLVVVCIAYVISDVVTHNIPLYYYEGFFTYLYGMSILFLLYVFCFLLQESTCCAGNETPPPTVKTKPDKSAAAKTKQAKDKEKEKKKEEEKKKKEEEKKKKEEKEKQKKEKKEKDKEKDKDKDKDKKTKKQEKKERFPRKMRDVVQQRTPQIQSTTYRRNSEGVVDAGLASVPVPVAEIGALSDPAALGPQEQAGQQTQPTPPTPPVQQTPTTTPAAGDVEAGTLCKTRRKRKTTQNDQSYGSFFLRIGAIAFGLATMIYNGLEFGSFFEVPFNSPCYMILQGINPVLQMIFTFMQMYFIFMNSRLNIHRFKVIARFGLMHVAATNLCVWIRTLVLEYIKEITVYHKNFCNDSSLVSEVTTVTHHHMNPDISRGVAHLAESIRQHSLRNEKTVLGTHLRVPDVVTSTAAAVITSTPSTTTTTTLSTLLRTTGQSATSRLSSVITTLPTTPSTTTRRVFTTPTTVTTTLRTLFHDTPTTRPTAPTTTAHASISRLWKFITSTASTTSYKVPYSYGSYSNFDTNDVVNVVEDASMEAGVRSALESSFAASNGSELIDNIQPQALTFFNFTALNISNSSICGRVNIMGTIVQDSAPYLYPFIIEYSLIGAAVIYVMWKHIGRNPKYITEEDLEHRLEVMLSRRAVAIAHAQQQGRVDCVGASKGLFFGLLMLVGSLICLILFFVLIHQPNFNLLAIYLADVSHCVLMVLSIIAIIIGFIRVQSLKFKTEEQSDLNDILLRVSAFGLFLYAIFSIIAGHLNAFTKEPNLLVMITGVLSVVQVILQLLFIADVSRRRVHLPEHDRSKPGRQVVTFLLICNVTMWIIYTFEFQKVEANPVQLDFYGFLAWAIVQRVTLPLCIFHRFHSAVTLAEIWKGSYKARLE